MIDRLSGYVARRSGGRHGARMVLVLAAVLALDSADKGAVGASAPNLQRAFDVGTTGIGLLVTVSSLVGAIATLWFGSLVDRLDRVRLLAGAVALWSLAMIASASATSFAWLLVARLFLGGVTATAFPAVASLVGDAFPQSRRSRVLGLILAGELVGAGVGLGVASVLSSLWSWRAAFALLAVPSSALVVALWRLPEPSRGGQTNQADGGQERASPSAGAGAGPGGSTVGPVATLVDRRHVEPRTDRLLTGGGGHLSLREVLVYVLRVRTNVVVMVASALGYYMLAGIRTFGVEFAHDQYGVPQHLVFPVLLVVGLGALGGAIAGGRLVDLLLDRGHLDARIVFPAVAFGAAAVFLAPALATGALLVALPALTLGAAFLGATNPALDAARLDVMPYGLWGRAEAVRTALRTAFEALAPLVFGAMTEHVFGGRANGGLRDTIAVMLVTLIAAPFILLAGRRTYPRDVATALASNRSEAPDHS